MGQVTIIVPEIGSVEIGGKTYKTTKIGNQTWLAENLDFTWEGLSINNPNGDQYKDLACYAKLSETDYGWNGLRYGLFYNWNAKNTLATRYLPTGWRLPTNNDFQNLVNFIGSGELAFEQLRSVQFWNVGGGVDLYGFNSKGTGRFFNNYVDEFKNTWYWTTGPRTEAESAGGNAFEIKSSIKSITFDSLNGTLVRFVNIRLIKDT